MVLRRLFLYQVQFLNHLGEIISGRDKGTEFEIKMKKTGKTCPIGYCGDELGCQFVPVNQNPYPKLTSNNCAAKVKREIVKELKNLQNRGFLQQNFVGNIKYDFNQKVWKSRKRLTFLNLFRLFAEMESLWAM